PLCAADVSAREVDVIAAKSFSMIDEGDLLIGVLSSGAGYGDALRREPERVAHDVYEGLVSVERAESVYGVVVGDGGVLDEERTAAARERLRAERLALGRPVAGDAGGGTVEGGT